MLDILINDVDWDWTILQLIFQTATPQQAHNQVSRIRFAPIIIQRHNVRVFQAGDKLSLGLKAANEIGVVGITGQNNFDGHIALNGWLQGPVDNTKATAANLLTQLKSFDRPAGQVFQANLIG